MLFSAVLHKPPSFLFQKCCQEDLKVSYFPEPNQQCGVDEGSAALTEDSCPAPTAPAFSSTTDLVPGGLWKLHQLNQMQNYFLIESFTLLSKSTLIIPIIGLSHWWHFSHWAKGTTYFPYPHEWDDTPKPSPPNTSWWSIFCTSLHIKLIFLVNKERRRCCECAGAFCVGRPRFPPNPSLLSRSKKCMTPRIRMDTRVLHHRTLQLAQFNTLSWKNAKGFNSFSLLSKV